MTRTIGVIGAGTMGSGIAQTCAVAGLQVVMVDVTDAALDRGKAAVGASLERLVKSGKLASEKWKEALGRISTSTDYAATSVCQIVIEAATERIDVKTRILQQLDTLLPASAVIATNTSSLSITQLAAVLSKPERLIGMHFFNPVPLMALVEVIQGLQTSSNALDAVETLCGFIGKTPIRVKNSPGFVVNRILCPMINEAILVLQEGLATAEDIDSGMKLGCNHSLGPLALADLIGLDTLLAIMEVLQQGFGDPKYRPAPLLREMVHAGRLGRKAGWGFFRYA